MKWKPGVAALLLIAAIPLTLTGLAGTVGSVALAGFGLGAGWLLIPRFWRVLFHGALGGVVAGLLILGPGFRMAMRVVAILDPVRSPEFTWDGTLFILVGVGAMLGGLVGIFANVAHKGFSLAGRIAPFLPAVMVMVLIGMDSELRSEILELGAGPWLNIPMFAGVALLYGAFWARVINRLEVRETSRNGHQAPIEVPA